MKTAKRTSIDATEAQTGFDCAFGGLEHDGCDDVLVLLNGLTTDVDSLLVVLPGNEAKLHRRQIGGQLSPADKQLLTIERQT